MCISKLFMNSALYGTGALKASKLRVPQMSYFIKYVINELVRVAFYVLLLIYL